MKIDSQKIAPTPKDRFEAVDFMNKAQQDLISAVYIMRAIIDNPEDEYREIHEKRMNDFIGKYI